MPKACDKAGCTKPRFQRYKICRDHWNEGRRARYAETNGKGAVSNGLLTPDEVARRAARNYRALSDREAGVTDLSPAYAHAKEVGAIDRGGGTVTLDDALAVVEKAYPRLRSLLAQMDAVEIDDAEA